MPLYFNHLPVLYLLFCLLFGQEATAQLSEEQQAQVKAATEKFCEMITRLATDPRDDAAFGALVDLFEDASNNWVHNDLVPGTQRAAFMEYLSVVKSNAGSVKFTFGKRQYFYLESYGLLFGIAEVEKGISGGFQVGRTVKAYVVVNVKNGKIGEVVHALPPGAVRFGQSPSVQPQQPSQPVVSTRPNTDLPYLPEMVYVEGGTFTMGCTGEQGSDCGSDEMPVHRVTVNSFYLAKTEVTQKQWRAVMGSNPSYFKNCEDCPVEQVSWHDAIAYCQKLSAMTGQTWRLPTEAEWEYAARGGNESRGTEYAGSNLLEEVGWYSGSKTHPVAQKSPNELGLYDITGNVWEWCQDWYGGDYYASSPTTNPKGPSIGSKRVLRGGGWGGNQASMRISYRNLGSPDYRYVNFGFRPLKAK